MTEPTEIRLLQEGFISGDVSRRAFIGRAVALGVSLSAIGAFLAACSTSATPAPATQGTASQAPASQPPAGQGGGSGALANTKDLGSTASVAFKIPADGHPGVIVKLADGSFVAYDATCTHQGCTVAYDAGSRLLACPCHGSRYDPAQGAKVVAGPAPRPLAELPIKIDQATGSITLAG
jgi:thiosulfate dehydrogenase [quinone] large subunit